MSVSSSVTRGLPSRMNDHREDDDMDELKDSSGNHIMCRDAAKEELTQLIQNNVSHMADSKLKTYVDLAEKKTTGCIKKLSDSIAQDMLLASPEDQDEKRIVMRIGQRIYQELNHCLQEDVIRYIIHHDLIAEVKEFMEMCNLNINCMEEKLNGYLKTVSTLIIVPDPTAYSQKLELMIKKYMRGTVVPRLIAQLKATGTDEETIADLQILPYHQLMERKAIKAIFKQDQINNEIDDEIRIPLLQIQDDEREEFRKCNQEKAYAMNMVDQVKLKLKMQIKISDYCQSSLQIIDDIQEKFSNYLPTIMKYNSNLYDIMNRMVLLPVYKYSTKEIHNPVERRNIVGIYWIAKKEFSKVTFSTLAQAYVEAFTPLVTAEQFERSPMSFIKAINDKYVEWSRDNIYETMTKDIFWCI